MFAYKRGGKHEYLDEKKQCIHHENLFITH